MGIPMLSFIGSSSQEVSPLSSPMSCPLPAPGASPAWKAKGFDIVECGGRDFKLVRDCNGKLVAVPWTQKAEEAFIATKQHAPSK